MSQLDYIDQQIILQLRQDARKPFSKIAEKLSISNSLVHQRIKKMRSEGVVTSAEFTIDPIKLGYKTKAYTGIKLREARFAETVMRALETIEELVECNYVSGNYAIFVLIYAKDNKHLQEVLYQKIHLIDGVAGTDTFICFDTTFKRPIALDFSSKTP